MPDQDIITELAKVQREVKANCQCGGSGELKCMGETSDYDECPDCAEVRALDLCWHEWKNTGELVHPLSPNASLYKWKCTCGLSAASFDGPPQKAQLCDNPDLTTHMEGSKLWIVHCLITLGEWEKFVGDMNDGIDLACFSDPEHDCKCYMKVADILTSGELLVEAISSFLEQRVV